MISGGTPATPQDTTRARGFRPRRRASSASATTSAAAPSTMPLALPAVTNESFPKEGFNAANPSSVVSGRMWSSASTVTVLRPWETSTGTISSLKTPALTAAAAAFWLRKAYASMASRVMPWRRARLSEVCAMYRPHCVSRRATISESSSFPSPRRRPVRAPRMTCGAWVMFSMPPARARPDSPRRIMWAAETTDWIPDPHSRFTVRAGTSTGMPAFRPTWRAP